MSSTLRMLGVLIAVVGIWGALVPFVGPLFGYPMPPGAGIPAWEWTASNWQLHLAPGALAAVGGLMVTTARRAGLGSLLALIGGAWFVVGNEFARLWLPVGGGGAADAGEWMTLATVLGYHDGTGLALVLPAAIALGIAAARRGARTEPTHRREPGREPVGAGQR